MKSEVIVPVALLGMLLATGFVVRIVQVIEAEETKRQRSANRWKGIKKAMPFMAALVFGA